MKRSKFKNIINRSKELSKPTSAFDKFKNSLPKEVPVGYRLQAAWEAYGKPANYKEAVWLGLIQPIDENTIKWPSIGYNTETEEYEYLNEGRENDTIAKDIRVWDNDVIPFVQELKRGGYVRAFNEEKNCWTYSKNPLAETFDPEEEVIEQFQMGGKTNRNLEDIVRFAIHKNPRFIQRLFEIPKALDFVDDEGKQSRGSHYLEYAEENGKDVVYPRIQEDENSNLKLYSSDEAWKRANKLNDVLILNPGEGKIFTTGYKESAFIKPFMDRWNSKFGFFKQGGQMNLIPEGALHARKNNLEGAGEDFTAKGIPVMTTDGKEQVAEIEHSEIILNKELTDFIEENYKKFKSDETSEKEKDELAIKVGKKLVKDILTNTDDRTNLIETVQEQM